jgi:hypothetical protein
MSDERTCFDIDLHTGDAWLDALRRRLADAARRALPDVRAGNFDAADAAVLAVDRDIQASVMLGAIYTAAVRDAVGDAVGVATRPEYIDALHERALRWRLSAYPEPHTADEADSFSAGRDADQAQLAALRQPRD